MLVKCGCGHVNSIGHMNPSKLDDDRIYMCAICGSSL